MNKNKPIDLVRTKRLLTSGVIAGPLFTLTWIIESATRANYNPLRHPVSSLALGEFGWMQVISFIIAGLLSIALAVGLRRTVRLQRGSFWGPLLIAIWGIGLIGAGVFITDPVSGYPLGTPDQILIPSTHGAVHDQTSLLGFLALTIACFVMASYFASQGERGWTFYSILTGLLFPMGIFLASAAFAQTESLVAFGGLIQRVTITLGWTWLTLLSIHFLNTVSKTSRGSNNEQFR